MHHRWARKPGDHYELLGVDKNATPGEIKSAYRLRAREYHPDRSTRPDAAAEFSKLNEAYRTLMDAEKRKEYDAQLIAEIYDELVLKPIKDKFYI